MKNIHSPLDYFGNRGPIQTEGFHSQQSDDLYALLSHYKIKFGKRACCYELFSGSGSLGILAMVADIADRYVINDSFPGFCHLWQQVKKNPAPIITTYTNLVKELRQADNPAQYYLSKQAIFNVQLKKNSFNDNAAGLLGFLINHVENGMLHFKQENGLTVLNSTYQDKKIDNVNAFANMLKQLHQLFQKRQVTFHAKSFQHFQKDIKDNDFLLLDPPYPSLDDASRAPEHHVYHRPQTTQVLQIALEKMLQMLQSKNIPYLMFYGLCGKEGAMTQPPIADDNIWLRLSGGKQNPFGTYVEYLYCSNHFISMMYSLPRQRFEKYTCFETSIGQQPYQAVASQLQKRTENNTSTFLEARLALLNQIVVIMQGIRQENLPTLKPHKRKGQLASQAPSLWLQIIGYLHDSSQLGKTMGETKALISFLFSEKSGLTDQLKEKKPIKVNQQLSENGYTFSSKR